MKQKQEIQYRYYEMPTNAYLFALLGKGWVRSYGHDSPALHYHNYMEIGYCLKGSGTIILGDSHHQYYAGCFTIIPANYPHNTISNEGTKCHWEYLFIDAKSFISDFYYNNSKMRLNLHGKTENYAHFFNNPEEREIAQLILMIMETYRYKEDLYHEVAKGFLLALIARISRLTHYLGENLTMENSDMKAIISALQYIELEYKTDIKISELANECHISETHFRRIFKESTGISPLAYLNLFRVEAACRQMRTTNKRISDIVFQCGFASQPSFNRSFKQLLGVTPTQWRKDNNLDKDSSQKQGTTAFNGWQ